MRPSDQASAARDQGLRTCKQAANPASTALHMLGHSFGRRIIHRRRRAGAKTAAVRELIDEYPLVGTIPALGDGLRAVSLNRYETYVEILPYETSKFAEVPAVEWEVYRPPPHAAYFFADCSHIPVG